MRGSDRPGHTADEAVELVAVGVAEGDGHGQRIGGVVGLWDGGQVQQHPGHLLHLFFHGLAVAGDSLLDLHGGVLVDGQARLRRRQQDDAARLGYADDGGLVVLVEQLFDSQRLGPGALDDLFDARVHLVQTPLERYARVGAHRAIIHRREPVARIIHHAPAHDGIAGVDAQNSHAVIPSDTIPIINQFIIPRQNGVSNTRLAGFLPEKGAAA